MNNKSNLFLATLLLATLMIQAQTETSDSRFYIKVNAGYGLITPGSYKLVSTSNAGGASGNTSLSKQGLGSGVRASAGVGVIISDFLNIGADVEYLSGATLKSNASYLPPSGYSYVSNQQISYTSLSITPHVIFKALSKPDYLIYNKLGILLNLPMDLKKTQKDESEYAAVPYSYTADISGTYKVPLTVGLNVALGVQFRLTDKLRGYAEIFGNYLVLSPTNYDETSAVVLNGAPDKYETHTKYIKNGETSYTSNGNTNNSVETVSGHTFNMNTLGINIGIAYRF